MYRSTLFTALVLTLTTFGCSSDPEWGGVLLTVETEEGRTYEALSGELTSTVIISDTLGSSNGEARPLSNNRNFLAGSATDVEYSLDFSQPAPTIEGYSIPTQVIGIELAMEDLVLVDKTTSDTISVRTRRGDYVYFDAPVQIRENELLPVTFTLIPERLFSVNGESFLNVSDSQVESR